MNIKSPARTDTIRRDGNVETLTKKTTISGNTHVALAANISCLFAFVHTLSAAAKSSVNVKIRQIFNELCPETRKSTAEGPTSRATVVTTRTSRTTMSIRRLLQRRRWSSSVRFASEEDVNSLCDISDKARRINCHELQLNHGVPSLCCWEDTNSSCLPPRRQASRSLGHQRGLQNHPCA